MAKQLQIGVLSEGRLRPQDILPVLADALASVDENGNYAGLIEDAHRSAEDCDAADQALTLTRDQIGDIYEYAHDLRDRLYEAMQEFAPPYCYVGPHEGDGACIGTFPDSEILGMDVGDGELACIGPDQRFPAPQPSSALEVNDHGNMTLYQWDAEAASWREVWSIV